MVWVRAWESAVCCHRGSRLLSLSPSNLTVGKHGCGVGGLYDVAKLLVDGVLDQDHPCPPGASGACPPIRDRSVQLHPAVPDCAVAAACEGRRGVCWGAGADGVAWPAEGRAEWIEARPRRGRFVLSDRLWAVLVDVGGNASALYRRLDRAHADGLLEDVGVGRVPSASTLQRVVRRDVRAGWVLEVARPGVCQSKGSVP